MKKKYIKNPFIKCQNKKFYQKEQNNKNIKDDEHASKLQEVSYVKTSSFSTRKDDNSQSKRSLNNTSITIHQDKIKRVNSVVNSKRKLGTFQQ